MASIYEYLAVTARNAEDLSAQVQGMIDADEGWQPLGLVTMDEDNLVQVLVKYVPSSG